MKEHRLAHKSHPETEHTPPVDLGGKYGRRALIVGTAAGVGAAASLVSGKTPAFATEGKAVLAGETNSATNTTRLTASSGTGLHGISVKTSGLTSYIAGVSGDSNTNDGVVGLSSAGYGVLGFSTAAAGVRGQSSVGSGVSGVTNANGESGILAQDISPEGGYGLTCGSDYGVALSVGGVAEFFQRSGLTAISAGEKSATVEGVSLSAASSISPGSLVLANLQNLLPGVYVVAVVPDITAKSFTIQLSEAVPSGKTAQVGWFIVN